MNTENNVEIFTQTRKRKGISTAVMRDGEKEDFVD